MPPSAQPQSQAASSTLSNLHCKPLFLTASKSFWVMSLPKHIFIHGVNHEAICPNNLKQPRARSKQTGKHPIHCMDVEMNYASEHLHGCKHLSHISVGVAVPRQAASIRFGHRTRTVTSHLPTLVLRIPGELQHPTALTTASGMLTPLIAVEIFHPALVWNSFLREEAQCLLHQGFCGRSHGWL